MIEKCFLFVVGVFLLSLVSVGVSSVFAAGMIGQQFSAEKSISNPWGMNVHLVFDSAKPHMNNICTAMKNAGVQFVRVDAYWSYDDMLGQKSLLDSAIFFAEKHGFEVLLNFPTVPSRRDSLSIVKWCEMLATYVNRYNGNTAISIDGETRFPKVRYFEAMNELDFHYKEMKLSVKEAFELIKKSSVAIRSVRTDSSAKVVLPGLSSFEPFAYALLNYKDSYGISINELVDVMSYHDYNPSESGWEYDVKERLRSFSKTAQGKEVWLTEYGSNIYETTFDEQASYFTKRSIVALANGIDKVFYYQFHYYGGNTFKLNNQREDFFGMVDTGIKNSYMEFLENKDDGDYSIMTGKDPIPVYITKKNLKRKWVSLHNLNFHILSKMKSKGLKISGHGFNVDSMAFKHKTSNRENVFWRGSIPIDRSLNRTLSIAPAVFDTLSNKNRLLVDISNVQNISDEWNDLKVFPVYEAYSFLSSMLAEGSTKPHLITDAPKGVVMYSWHKNDGRKISIFWSAHENNIAVESAMFKKNFIVFDNLGQEINSVSLVASKSPTFVVEQR